MEIEKIKKVTENYNRIKDLRWVAKEIYGNQKCVYALTFANIYPAEKPIAVNEAARGIICNILKKHQDAIYSEIATEIRMLEKELEDL